MLWLSLIDHPRFREAVALHVAGILAQKDQVSPTIRWLTSDLGRSATLMRILLRQSQAGRVTVGDILAATRVRHTASDGRALQVLRRAEAAGLIQVTPQSGPWRFRTIQVLPPFMAAWRERAAIEIEAAAVVTPAIAGFADSLPDDGVFLDFLRALSRFERLPPEVRGPPNPAIRLFHEHEAGLLALYACLLRQPLERDQLLEAAAFSRTGLAGRLKVSRTHIGRLFAAAEAAGHLCLATPGQVHFSQSTSREAERHFALTFHVIAESARIAMESSAERPNPVTADTGLRSSPRDAA